MSDFRARLYARYVSRFKGAGSRLTDEQLVPIFEWYGRKYLPLLDDLPRDAPILELGCGPGYLMEFLRRHGFSRVRGIDISEEQAQLARSRGLQADVADVFDFLARAPRQEAILAIDFFEHFSRDELMRLCPAVHAALAPAGRLILQTPNGSGLFPRQVIYGDLTHMTIFTPEALEQLLRLWGFDRFEFRETGPVPRNLVGRVRLAGWGLVKLAANALRRIETGKSQRLWTENLICCCRRAGDDAATSDAER